MTPSADESALILTTHLKKQEPFSYWRFGDGFLELMMQRAGRTCDCEAYTPELQRDLLGCWLEVNFGETVKAGARVYLGDWQAASFSGPNDPSRYAQQWYEMLGDTGRVPRNLLHPEALLFMRQSQELAAFYQTLRADKRRKLYMGPADNEGAAHWLDAEFLPTPMKNLHASVDRYTRCLTCDPPADIVIFGAGLAGMIPAVRAWEAHPDRTYIHVGSAFDPLFRGKSRKQQLSREQCWRLLGGEPK